MKLAFAAATTVCLVCCQTVRAADDKNPGTPPAQSVQVQKGPKGNLITITGRLTSRHARFRKGRSVREYFLVTSDSLKIPLPRSHVVHRDGSISGIDLKTMRGCNVRAVCSGRITKDGDKITKVFVKKVISISKIPPPEPPSFAERFKPREPAAEAQPQ